MPAGRNCHRYSHSPLSSSISRQDTEKVRLKEEVFAAVKSDDMVPLYETLVADSILEKDQSLLDSMRAKNEEELKKHDEKHEEEELDLQAPKANSLSISLSVRLGQDADDQVTDQPKETAEADNRRSIWVIKSGTINHLPKFHGLTSESPYDHLREFSWVCDSMKPQEVDILHAKFRAFPWSLQGDAKRWFFNLSIESIRSWDDMSRVFLAEYFPATKASSLRKELVAIQQKDDEHLYQYYERFQRLQRLCPPHGIEEAFLILFFYDGMLQSDQRILDAASCGALINLTPAQARKLIETMANNERQYRVSNSVIPASEVRVAAIESKLSEIILLLETFVGRTP